MPIYFLSCFAALLVCVLYDLKRENKCLDVKTMMELLHGVHHDDGKPSCRIHLIHILADHFGPDAKTPNFCRCDGKIDLQRYYTDVSDGTTDRRDSCLKDHNSYKFLFYKFFESSHSHAGSCRTHDSIWYHLDKINRDGTDHDGCQKEFILHLRYSFNRHSSGHCTCKEVSTPSTRHTTHPSTEISTRYTMQFSTRLTTHSATRPRISLSNSLTTKQTSHQTIHDLHCLGFESYKKLLHLGTENGCLSANSVWHYLDDLQAKDSKCRKSIQHHLASKYRDANFSSKMSNLCSCHEKTQLSNHEHVRLRNGSYGLYNHGPYSTIISEFFSNIREHGCQNHHILSLTININFEGINDHCLYHRNGTCRYWINCQQDLIVRAFIQYPTDESDECVCSKAPATTANIASPTATSATIPQTSLSATTTQRIAPKIPFACNKIEVIESIAGSLASTNVNSSKCVSGSSDDALLLSSCNVTSPSTWKKGANVIADCEAGSQLIPTYTPITTFDSDIFFANGAQSGIFLGCIHNGIKIAIQKCHGVPEIVHIEHGTFQNNPRNYYVIVTNE